jgi:hypothetical protein
MVAAFEANVSLGDRKHVICKTLSLRERVRE